MPRKQILKFLSDMFPKLPPEPLSPTRGPATIFETGMNWNELLVICKQQVKFIKDRERNVEKAEEKRQKRKKRQKILQMLPQACDEVKKLAKRRHSRKNPHVMVIEDDPFTQKLIRKILPETYEVSFAKNGYEAFLAYAHKAPDLVFLDIGLPDVTGHDILEKLLHVDPESFIVMLSGNGDQDNVLRAIKAGAKGFIGKPFTKDKVRQYVQKSPHIQSKR